MPTINFAKTRPSLQVEVGTNLMQALLDGGLPVASSCGGDGVCAKCRIQIVPSRDKNGGMNLTPETELERTLRERHQIAPDLRISCQVQILGNVTVDASYW